MNIERLTSLETQLELLTTSVEEKDQSSLVAEIARTHLKAACVRHSMWANHYDRRFVIIVR